MTYTSKDRSTHDGEPLEAFRFIGRVDEWRYTNAASPVTVAGQEYTPTSITRGNIEVSSVVDSIQTVDVSMPFDLPIADEYRGIATPEILAIEIYRAHRSGNPDTEYKLVWSGDAVAYQSSGRLFVVSTGNAMQADLNAATAAIYYQNACNHELYDERCKADRATNSTVATVTGFDSTGIQVDDDGAADSFYRAGEAENMRTGERRLIIDNVVNSISLSYGFLDVQLGDTITLYAGCDHTFTTCNSKFNNLVNYGGFMYVPESNPFVNGV